MALIKLELNAKLVEGMDVKFEAPCDCTNVTGLLVSYLSETGELAEKNFTFRDKHGNDLTGLGNLFSAGAFVKAMLDVKSGRAYLQTAGSTAFPVVVELPAENWIDNTQTVTVDGATVANMIIVSAAPENYAEYCESGVYCSAQTDGALVFTCSDVPGGTLRVNVALFN